MREARHKDTQGVTPLRGNAQDRLIHRHGEWVPGCRGLGEGWGDFIGRGLLLGGWNALKAESGDVYTIL